MRTTFTVACCADRHFGDCYARHTGTVALPAGIGINVMTRQGLRQWPKSKRSHRVAPVPPHILEGVSVLMAGRPRDALVFTAPHGGPVTDEHFRNRVWYPAIAAAGVRRFPPRIMRHTAASWLVQDGVPLYDVQALLGHEDYATTQRYAHLAPDAHSKVIESWSRRLGVSAHQWRTGARKAVSRERETASDLGRGGRI